MIHLQMPVVFFPIVNASPEKHNMTGLIGKIEYYEYLYEETEN